LRHVAAHAVLVGGRMIRLVDAGIDGAPKMLEEGPVDPVVDLGDRVVLDAPLPSPASASSLATSFGDLYRTN
jgi:hypothetical protein